MATYKDYEYKGYHVRYFSEDVEINELVWHRDRKDRYITPIGETDWQIQFDDEDGWPEEPDGEGASLERIVFTESDELSWRASVAEGGSPGTVILPSVKPASIKVLNASTVRLSFDAQPGVLHELVSADDLNAPDWKVLFHWDPIDAAMTQSIDLETQGNHRYFRIESK